MNRLIGLAAAIAVFATAPVALAQPAPAFDKTFVTHHTGVFGGQKVNYTATVASSVLTTPEGKPGVNFVTTDYVRDGVADASKRPVIFAWAGGPSGPSTAYHMRMLGPRQVIEPPRGRESEPATIRDNPDALLDIADIVLVDPAETGFSRVLPDGKRAYYYSVGGDAASIIQFMDRWLKAHGRENSPRYVMGGSYGSVRSIRVAYESMKAGRSVDGVIVTANSTMIQEMGGIVGPAATLATYADVAAYHGKADRRGRSDQQITDEAYRFAMHEYLPALATVQDATSGERAAMADKLSAMTGVPAKDILANDLVISRDMFNKGLLKAEGRVLNDQYDGRNSTLAADPKPAPASGGAHTNEMFLTYMAKELGVTYPMDQYAMQAPDSGKTWNYDAPAEAKRGDGGNDWGTQLKKVMAANPKLRFYSANGYYDMTSALGQARWFFSRTKLPRERVEVHEYPGGHGLYADPETARLISRDIRKMITTP
jgi:carboxypeptidase C (cathepsin A)